MQSCYHCAIAHISYPKYTNCLFVKNPFYFIYDFKNLFHLKEPFLYMKNHLSQKEPYVELFVLKGSCKNP